MDILSSIFVTIFGDTPTKIVFNSALLIVLMYYLWRLIVRPIIDTLLNAVEVYRNINLSTLEIIPPKQNEIDTLNTQNLFTVLQQQLAKRNGISLEITSNKKDGIRYRIVAPSNQIATIQKHFASYMPELRFKHATNTPASKDGTNVFYIQQSRHFAFPLKPHNNLEKADPIAFMAGSMTRLLDNEEITLQFVVRRYSSREASKIYNRLLAKGNAIIGSKIRYYFFAYIWLWVLAALIGLLANNWQTGVSMAIIFWVATLFAEQKQKELTTLEESLYEDITAKLEQPLIQTDIRLGVASTNRSNELINAFTSSLGTLNTPGFQYLKLARQSFGKWRKQHLNTLYSRRIPSVFSLHKSILSTTELATLFHFPRGIIKTEGVVRSHSKTLPAPQSLLSNPKLDITIGVNKHHGTETPIGLTNAERERHMFVVGGTGSGKTTMLKYQIIQDIQNDKGVAVVDPHGDLAEELLNYIPESRMDDVIYLNPDDLDNPIGINLLELPDGLTGNDLLREKDRITESVISVMRKIFSEDDSGGHRIEYILRNSIQTALTLKNPTLFTIFRLLNDGKFAKDVIKNLEDEDLKTFWRNEIGKAGSMQKVKMAAGITSKIGRFLFSASARAMLEQEKSTINFDEILDGKILICNFSKGRLGEDTSMLFGITILAKLQLAALKRSEKKQSDRKPFYLYVDEFQNFATLSFTQMLSEARKYKVFLTMAEQSTQQQDDQKLVNIILANVGTVVAFRTGSPKDEELLLPLFEPYIEKGEISNLSAYNFYCRITGVNAQEPMSGETVLIS